MGTHPIFESDFDCLTAAWVKKRDSSYICEFDKPEENDLGWKEACGWKTYITFSWIAFVQACVIMAFATCNKIHAAGNNAALTLMFSALYIGMLAPAYVQTGIWKDIKDIAERPDWMKMEIASLCFA